MISRQCLNCANRIGSGDGPVTCAAFPEAIPEEILAGEVDHSLPYPEDNRFRYNPIGPDNE